MEQKRNMEKKFGQTVAELGVTLATKQFCGRSFLSLLSSILYALNITRINPASAFTLLRGYTGVY